MRIAIVGAGAMGAHVAHEIARSDPGCSLVVIDADGGRAGDLSASLAECGAASRQCDARDTAALSRAFAGSAVVVNAAQYDVNCDVMQACLAAGCNYLDLGGMFHTTRRQLGLSDAFREAGLTAVLGMGAAPGMTNVLARLACDQLEAVDSIELAFAVSVRDAPAAEIFSPPYSIRTIMQEFCEESVQFLDGAWRRQPPLSGRKGIQFAPPIGLVDCIYTLHSEPATLPDAFASKGVREVSWRLCLPAELEAAIKAFASAGLGSTAPLDFGGASVAPIDLLAASIERGLRAAERAAVPYTEHGAMRIEVQGACAGTPRSLVIECSLEQTGTAPDVAGIMTGTPCAIAAMMMARGEVSRPGVFGPESVVPPREIVRQLGRRGFLTGQTERMML